MTARTLDPVVRGIAHDFSLDVGFARLIQAVVDAEGNILKAVQCSVPGITTREAAIRIVCKSAVHAMTDWILAGGEPRQDDFIASWAKRWAPQGATNDQHNLNANWASNVDRLWTPTPTEKV